MKVNIPEDEAWLERRKKDWFDYLNSGGGAGEQEDPVSLEKNRCLKRWLVYGDLSGLLESQHAGHYHNFPLGVMKICPTEDYSDFLRVFEDYMLWVSEHRYAFWSETYDKDPDADFLEKLSFYTRHSSYFLSSNINAGLFLDVYGERPQQTIQFPFALGKNSWRPKTSVDPVDVASNLILPINQYLFGKHEAHQEYSHARVMIDYFCEMLPQFDPYFYSLEYAKPTRKQARDPIEKNRIVALKTNQIFIRCLLANMFGYLTEYGDWGRESLLHHDLEAEAKIRQVLESDAMPAEYHPLVEYIHEHKEHCADPDEE